MVHIPYDAFIIRIIEKSGISKVELDKRIAEKLSEFSGLISKEGAAHIVANELQIPLGDIAAGPFKINELKLGMKNITVMGKVLTKYPVTTFSKNGRDGRVASLILADQTGNCRVTFWHDDVLVHERLKENDVISLSNLTTKENRSVLELTATSQTKIIRTLTDAQNETLSGIEGKKPFTVSETPSTYESNPSRTQAIRKSIEQISVNDPMVEIVGVIVQVFKPAAFTVDKQTGKKVKLEPGMPADLLHHEQRYVMNIVVDDGTETVRTVFFGAECQQLVGSQSLQIIKESEYEFSKTKTNLLGQTVKIVAKVVKNQMYDRIELITRTIEFNPDPTKELEFLKTVGA